MRQRYLITHIILTMSLFLGYPAALWAQEPAIQAQYSLTSKKRLSRMVSEYTFKATLINGDTAIKNVSATASSNSSFTTVIDGDVSFNDIEASATTESSDTFIIQQDRREAFGSESLSWNVSFMPDISSNLEVDGIIDPTRVITMREDKKRGLDITYRFSDKEKQTPFTLSLNQIIEPDVGLSLTPILNGEEYFDDDGDGRIHQHSEQLITATQPGEYTITTTATVVETGKKVSEVSKIKVYGMDDPMLSFSIGIRRLLAVDSTEILPVKVNIGGDEDQLDLITAVSLKQLESGEIQPLDYIGSKSTSRIGVYRMDYSGIVSPDAAEADHCYRYVVVAETSKGLVQSDEISKVCITGIPIGTNRAKRNAAVEPITGRIFANNMLQIRFQPGTSEQRMQEIAAIVDGEIIGQSSPYYQLELHHPVPLFQNLDEIMDQLRAFPEVDRVGASMKTGRLHSSSIANDPIYLDGYQPNLERIRADEAWFVTQGSDDLTDQIAVIDTGISFAHEDLAGRIISGFNFIDPSIDSDDSHYHGTHVAGIIAAATGNNKGIAGIASKNYLQAVKVSESREVWYEDIADGIRWSANLDENSSHTRAPVINISIGVPENPTFEDIVSCNLYRLLHGRDGPCDPQVAENKICNAVSAAISHKSLVVASAGNAAENAKQFPAACPGAIAVGATELYNDERWIQIGDPNDSIADKLFWMFGDIYTFFGFEAVPDSIGIIAGSNYGDWVDLAAPG